MVLVPLLDVKSVVPVPKEKKSPQVQAAVAKALRDNFKDFSPHQIDIALHEGLTLREQIGRRKLQALASPGRYPIGRRFYDEMRNLYRSDLAPASLLVVDDPGEAIQAGLMSAMIKFKHIGNKTGLTAWMQVAERPKQRETVGICQYALTLKPGTSAALLGRRCT